MKLNTPEPNLIFKDIRVPKKKRLEIAKIIKKDQRLKKVLNAHVDHLFFFLRCPACTKWSFC